MARSISSVFLNCALVLAFCASLHGGESEKFWANRINIKRYPLQRFFNLDLSHNGLSDLNYLQDPELKNIQGFGLIGNSITDISPLEYFDNLGYLELGMNLISDISPLRAMDKLYYLDLNCNRIRDIEPLRDLVQLFYLDLSGNNISDISVIKNLSALTTLNLNQNNISKLPPLQNLKTLKNASFKNNQITDISGLSSIPATAMISLGGNRLKLSQLYQITESHSFFDLGHQYNVPLIECDEPLIIERSYSLESEYIIGGVATRFAVIRHDGTTAIQGLDYQISIKGAITFKNPGRYYIKMTNDSVYSKIETERMKLTVPSEIFDEQGPINTLTINTNDIVEAYTCLLNVENCINKQ